MRVNFNETLRKLDGSALKGEKDADFKLSDAALIALNGTYSGEEPLSGIDKFKRHQLARRIYSSTALKDASMTCDVTAEEIALVKHVIAKAYGPIVLGPAYELLEGISEPKPDVFEAARASSK
jgi:hypothetical protein